jgi:hypothetical protein
MIILQDWRIAPHPRNAGAAKAALSSFFLRVRQGLASRPTAQKKGPGIAAGAPFFRYARLYQKRLW